MLFLDEVYVDEGYGSAMRVRYILRVCENSKLITAVVKNVDIKLHCGPLVEFCVGI